MKIYKINFFNFTYTFDFPVLLLFFGVFVDIVSTSVFVGLKIGTEANPILRDLISISVWFIPVYLLTTNAVFVPFLSSILRKTLCYTFGAISLLLGLNNSSLVLFDYAFLVDVLGFNAVITFFVLFGLIVFVYFIKKERLDKKRTISICLRLLCFIAFIGLIHLLFVIVTWFQFL